MEELKCPYCEKKWKYANPLSKHIKTCKMKEIIEEIEEVDIQEESEEEESEEESKEESKEESLDSIVNINDSSYMYKDDTIISINGDSSLIINNISSKSIQTICIDPPYNIKKDKWDDIDNYEDWLINIVVQLEDKLKDNGSFFIFHNEMEVIASLMMKIKEKTKLKFIQMITWNKRFESSKKYGYMNGYVVKEDMHMWNKMCEYILFYTKDNTWKFKEYREKAGVSSKTIALEVPSKTGGLTGWYGNLETGLNFPTKERMVPITKHIGLEYDDVVPKFRNQKTHHSVWNYDIAKRSKVHMTPKPIELLENIIKHTTDENDILLDCFAGTGSLGQACKNTNRRCILIEKEKKYFDFINSSLELSNQNEQLEHEDN